MSAGDALAMPVLRAALVMCVIIVLSACIVAENDAERGELEQ